MKKHLVNLLYEQFKFYCFIHRFSSLGIEFYKFEVDNNQIVMELMGFSEEELAESYGEGFDGELFDIIGRMSENEAVVFTDQVLSISADHEVVVKSELAKYVDKMQSELNELRKSLQ